MTNAIRKPATTRAVRTGTWMATWMAVVGLTLPAMAAPAAGQMADRKASFEVRGGINVPTFDIADVAKAGPSFGVGVAVPVTGRLLVMGDADFGFHDGETTTGGDGMETEGPDVNVYHYIGKLGYELAAPASPWSVIVNAGAGAMTFDVDAEGADAQTYFAINVGAKIAYAVTPRVSLFLSPQGDIAFSDEDEVGTDNAWVWPFAAGLRLNL